MRRRYISTVVLFSLITLFTSCAAAPTPQIVVTVKFKSRFSDDEIMTRYPKRMPEFHKLPGLLQKYYLHDTTSGEWAGIYLWDSQAAVDAYMKSDLRKSIPEAYGVVGQPRVEVLKVVDTLR